ncbi:MAG: sigma-70 family RNA polymerase sigma factor [Isosphaeraceae bacterium]|nr:sigma-70 family RNA polymerase sigma factor [Isosphaeraceae bacterium]
MRSGLRHDLDMAPDEPGRRPENERIGIDRPEEMGDARLVELARSGDDSAFAALVVRYERSLIRVLTRLVHDEELARDLAQETFWRVYRRLHRFDTSRRFGPWLFRIGVNLGVDHLRKPELPSLRSLDRRNVDGSRAIEPSSPDPRTRVDLAQEVQYILDRIPPAYRTILVLRDLEGFSSAEVAAIVGRREATIRWRLSKARDLFRELWDRRRTDPR